MTQAQQNERGVDKLDLAKYGLSRLEDKEIYQLRDDEIDAVLAACEAEDIAPAIYGLRFDNHNVESALGLSHCRRCGKCCLPHPTAANHPGGVMVYEEDLHLIAEHSKYSYKRLKKSAPIADDSFLLHRRYLPLPCMFYDKKNSRCEIYDLRPFICRTFPITDVPGQVGISINVICDYGKDIYKAIIERMKNGTVNTIFK